MHQDRGGGAAQGIVETQTTQAFDQLKLEESRGFKLVERWVVERSAAANLGAVLFILLAQTELEVGALEFFVLSLYLLELSAQLPRHALDVSELNASAVKTLTTLHGMPAMLRQ